MMVSNTPPQWTGETVFVLDNREITVHPVALLFPELPAPDFGRLVEDMKENGQHMPAVLQIQEDQCFLLDGRHRVKACEKLKMPLNSINLPSDPDPEAFILSLNVHRRHMSTAERAYVAANLANRKRGRPGGNAEYLAFTEDAAADRLSVSRGSVQQMKTILGDKILLPVVLRGNVSLGDAYAVRRATSKDKRRAIKKVELARLCGAPHSRGNLIRRSSLPSMGWSIGGSTMSAAMALTASRAPWRCRCWPPTCIASDCSCKGVSANDDAPPDQLVLQPCPQ